MIVTFRIQDEKARQDYERLRVDLENLTTDIEQSAKAQAGVFEQHDMALNKFNRELEESKRDLTVYGEIRTLQNRVFETERELKQALSVGTQNRTELERRVNGLEVFRMAQNQVNANLEAKNQLRGSYTPEEHRLAVRLDQVEHELATTNKRLTDLAKLLDGFMHPKKQEKKK